jgi:hypothetical protein
MMRARSESVRWLRNGSPSAGESTRALPSRMLMQSAQEKIVE